MRLPPHALDQVIGAAVALATAFGGIFWGLSLLGRTGVLLLLISVPAGLTFGWLTVQLIGFARRLLSESD